MASVRHLLKISDLQKDEIISIVKCAINIKKNPKIYSKRFGFFVSGLIIY
jgi:ornithine carbamoyltransferase